MVDEVRIPTAGYDETRPKLIARVAKSSCGNITDGVSLRFENMRGGFVVSWPEFKAAYEANAAIRDADRSFKPSAEAISQAFFGSDDD